MEIDWNKPVLVELPDGSTVKPDLVHGPDSDGDRLVCFTGKQGKCGWLFRPDGSPLFNNARALGLRIIHEPEPVADHGEWQAGDRAVILVDIVHGLGLWTPPNPTTGARYMICMDDPAILARIPAGEPIPGQATGVDVDAIRSAVADLEKLDIQWSSITMARPLDRIRAALPPEPKPEPAPLQWERVMVTEDGEPAFVYFDGDIRTAETRRYIWHVKEDGTADGADYPRIVGPYRPGCA